MLKNPNDSDVKGNDQQRDGYQRTLASCSGFEDGIKHDDDCPGSPDCDGDCKETIARKRMEFERKYRQFPGYGD